MQKLCTSIFAILAKLFRTILEKSSVGRPAPLLQFPKLKRSRSNTLYTRHQDYLLRKIEFFKLIYVKFWKENRKQSTTKVIIILKVLHRPATSNKHVIPIFDWMTFSINGFVASLVFKSFVQSLRNAGSVSFYFVWTGWF